MIREIIPPIEGLSRISRFNTDGKQITSEYMNNVRIQDLEKRFRICQRPGLDKWSTDQVGGADQPVVCILSVSTVK